MTEIPNIERRKSGRDPALILAFAALALLLYIARALIAPLTIACLLAYLLNPAVTFLRNHTKIRHDHVVILVYFSSLALILMLLVTLLPIATHQAQSLSHEIKILLPQMDDWISQSTERLGLDMPFESLLAQFQETSSQFFQPDRIFRVIKSATTNLAWVLIILVTTYYLLRDWTKLKEWLIQLAPESERADICRLHQETKHIWRSYFRGQLLLMLLVGFLSGLVAAALGLRRFLLLGLLAGFLDLIPSIGPAIAMVIAAILAFLEGSLVLPIPNSWFSILVVGAFALIQLVENVWLQPNIMGQRLQLHPGLVFVSIVGALTLGSALLALIILPTIGTTMLIGSYVWKRSLGQDPWSPPAKTSSNIFSLGKKLTAITTPKRKQVLAGDPKYVDPTETP
jgi:predicted PurR-regulated permease PerM